METPEEKAAREAAEALKGNPPAPPAPSDPATPPPPAPPSPSNPSSTPPATSEPAPLQADIDKAKEQVAKLKDENAKLSAQVTALNEAIAAQNTAILEGLDEADKALVSELAGENPLMVGKMVAKLKAAGKLGKGAALPPPATGEMDRSKIGGDPGVGGIPATVEDARKSAIGALRS